ncbi:hypothetical protein [Marinobacter sp. SS21]|uniref:hypothetical protein n=1 Tax=Marinobacter sp. SS21 TaxID=2979460 RepID=UPI00232C1647|nr:hypothetical protein [Marinobacter sp. SS21]MDC0663857.1 hypothetical protein [Marinobacter sp. SS21]
MEPIRPDDDELRGMRPQKSPKTKAGNSAVAKPDIAASGVKKTSKPRQPSKPGGRGHGGAGVGLWLLALLLVAGSALGGAAWFSQQQRIAALESQLEEADYWARQSKLALARFEGELSETGESLEETGASMAERLQAHSGRLDTVDQEIGKLWVLANERNRKQLVEQQARIGTLGTAMAGQQEALTAIQADIAALGGRLDAAMAKTNERMDAQGNQLAGRLQELSGQLDTVGDQVELRLRRFVQERSLAEQEVRTRVQALERRAGQQAEASALDQAEARLAQLEQTVRSIDSSRSQLTSRLVRLSDEVATLRQQMATQ